MYFHSAHRASRKCLCAVCAISSLVLSACTGLTAANDNRHQASLGWSDASNRSTSSAFCLDDAPDC